MNKALVITTHLGTTGGGALAPLLLCQELARRGMDVTSFTQHRMFGPAEEPSGFNVVIPRIRSGCRWQVPERVLAAQAAAAIRREKPELAIVCGLGRLTRFLLRKPISRELLLWEFTNANPGNSHVDEGTIRMFDRCRGMLSPSETIDGRIRETYGYAGRILRLPFWIEDHELTPDVETEPTGPDFIYLGRRDPEKGLHELVDATARVAQAHPDVRVLISGPGSEAPFREHVRHVGVDANVAFRFFESYRETLDVLGTSRCLVLPSYHEGYPLVLLEAAERAVPFIATRVGSIAEVFGGTPAGMLVPPRDTSALADAMSRILFEAPEALRRRRSAARDVFIRVSAAEVVGQFVNRLLADVREMGGRE